MNWKDTFIEKFTSLCKKDGKTYYDNPDGSYSDVWFGPEDLISFIQSTIDEERKETIQIIKDNFKSKEESELSDSIGLTLNDVLQGIINCIENKETL